MDYLSVAEIAKKWGVSDRSVRQYCAQGRVAGAFLIGKTWNIPANALKPNRAERGMNQLLATLLEQKQTNLKGGIYHKTQIELTYNSNHIEGSRLTQDQTRFIFETNTIGMGQNVINVDDVIETTNHFRCIDYILENAMKPLTEKMIKNLHFILKSGTSDSKKAWFRVGEYKQIPNEVGGKETTQPENVSIEIEQLLKEYDQHTHHTLEDILAFHYRFENIHPFQDGNGRVGRLIMFKECLKNDIVPFIIDEQHKLFYYRGLQEWKNEKGFLLDTCLSAQDQYKLILDYFKIPYTK